MANAINTLAGVINFNDANVDPAQVSDLLQDTPLLSALNAKPASNGTQHKYLKETVASAAAFRAVNAGLTKTYSQDELITATLQIIDAGFDFDKALLMGSVREDILAKELGRALRGAFVGIEKQVIYGTSTNSAGTQLGAAAGFAGLIEAAGSLDALADDMVVSAADVTTSTDDEQTSVYLIRSTDDDVSVVLGEDGQVEIGDPYEFKKVADVTADNKSYDAVGVSVLGYAGLQYGSTYSASRVCNVNNALTDDDIYNGLSLFPAGRQPNIIAMNRSSLKKLRDSRTATNQTGTPAPRPTEVEGIQIVVTDQIGSLEKFLS